MACSTAAPRSAGWPSSLAGSRRRPPSGKPTRNARTSRSRRPDASWDLCRGACLRPPPSMPGQRRSSERFPATPKPRPASWPGTRPRRSASTAKRSVSRRSLQPSIRRWRTRAHTARRTPGRPHPLRPGSHRPRLGLRTRPFPPGSLESTSCAREQLRRAEESLRRAEVDDLEARLGHDAIREQVLVELAGLGELGLRSLRQEVPGGVFQDAFDRRGEPDGEDDDGIGDPAALEAALALVVPRWEGEQPRAEPPSATRLATLRRRYHELGAANTFALNE